MFFLLSVVWCCLVVGYFCAIKAHDWIHKAILIYWEDFSPAQGGDEKKMQLVYIQMFNAMVFCALLGYAMLALIAISFLLFRMLFNTAAGVSTKEAIKGKRADWSSDSQVTWARFHHMFIAPRKPSRL